VKSTSNQTFVGDIDGLVDIGRDCAPGKPFPLTHRFLQREIALVRRPTDAGHVSLSDS
jgi:hypothetical protein